MSQGLFSSIRLSSSGLSGQRTKMDTIAKNLANAETTRTADGTPYRRERVVFSQSLEEKMTSSGLSRVQSQAREGLATTRARHIAGGPASGRYATPTGVDTEVDVAEDASEFKVVYDPGHPDADEEGYVLMPNVNVITEMVDMITASRAYEANIAAVQSAKQMFAKALDI
jgi:flagellar basal-body rod protein FlgC